MLSLEICKKCRITEYGPDGWEYFAEAWSDPNFPNRRQEPHIICPHDIILRWAILHFEVEKIYDGFMDKMRELGHTREDAKFVSWHKHWKNFFWRMLQIDSKQFWQIAKPPAWCPYKEDHRNAAV